MVYSALPQCSTSSHRTGNHFLPSPAEYHECYSKTQSDHDLARLGKVLRFFFLLIQPAFVNNPLCGLLILIATFLNPDWRVGLGMVLGGSIAAIGEMVSCQ